MIVRPNDTANATVAVATTAMIRRVLSEESRSNTRSLGEASLDDGHPAHAGENGLRLGCLHIADEAFGIGWDSGILVDERQGGVDRVVAVGRVMAVDLEPRELHFERRGEGAEADRTRHFLHGVDAVL